MKQAPISNECPYCASPMTVSKMTCHKCGIAVEGNLPLQRLGSLPIEHQRFIEMFVAGQREPQGDRRADRGFPIQRSGHGWIKSLPSCAMRSPKRMTLKGTILDASDTKAA